MGDVAWHRKYRPSSFDDYMGDNVKNQIVNRLKDRDNIPNTIMLYGTRGTGKTSMARLIAKEIHCLSPVDGHSCGQCEMCKEIDEYITSTEAGVECFGITEVDAASTTGKDSINEIIEEAIQPPVYPLEHKVLILDECHQLSPAAQNSLLKVIEEPPSFLVFILCTTDPQKVLETIHSRMQVKIEVRKKSVDEIVKKLEYIARQEGLQVTREALQIIAKKGDRVPRECINKLETVAKQNGNVVNIAGLRAVLGEIDNDIYLDYFKAANSSLEEIMLMNQKLKEKDISPRTFMSGLIRFMLDACYVKHGVALDDYSADFVKQVKELFKLYTSSEFDVLLQITEQASRGITDDDTKGELIITTTAIRIGKIGMLAQGLGDEQRNSNKENNLSLRRYKEHIDEDETLKARPMEAEQTKEKLSDVFKNMAELDPSIQIGATEISLTASQDKDVEDNKENADTSIVSTSELEQLLNS